jgi:hypothetical protein
MIKIILVAAPLDNLGINYVLTKAGYCLFLMETKKKELWANRHIIKGRETMSDGITWWVREGGEIGALDGSIKIIELLLKNPLLRLLVSFYNYESSPPHHRPCCDSLS